MEDYKFSHPELEILYHDGIISEEKAKKLDLFFCNSCIVDKEKIELLEIIYDL